MLFDLMQLKPKCLLYWVYSLQTSKWMKGFSDTIMLWGGPMLYTTNRVQIFLAHISGHNHNWLLHWFVPCYLQNHALLWQDNWMRFNVEMHSNSWCVCWWEDRTVSFHIPCRYIYDIGTVYCRIYSAFACMSIFTNYYICLR